MNRIETKFTPLRWLMAFLMTALLAGCGGGGQDPILGGDGSAGLAPMVTTVFPAPRATGVPVNTRIITAAFTKAMDPTTLTAASFTLTCPSGTPQTGTVGYLKIGEVATLTLAITNTLPANSICTASITTDAKDTSGIPLASNFVWTFATGLVLDNIAPTVTGTIHTNGQTDVAVNTKVGATFSEAMDPLSISTATFTLKQGTTLVPGTVTYAGINALFTPASNLAPSTPYTMTVTTGAKDVSGNALAANFTIGWTTGVIPDTTAPTVTGTIQTNGQTDVAINTNIGVTFSEGMDPLTITTTNLSVKETVSGKVVVGAMSYSGVSAVFNPVNDLVSNTAYTLTVKGGTTGVKDLAGNPLVADFKIGWTTAAAPDTTAPTVTGSANANGATGVAINTAAGVTFSEGMNPLTVTNANFALTTDAGVAVPGTVSYSGVSAAFRPISNLANNTHYNVIIRGGLTGVKDLAGNPMVADFKYGWTTAAAPDTTAPTVTGTTNVNRQTNVAINTAVGATFSEGMDPLTITNLNFTLTTDGGAAVPGTVSYSGVSAVFKPLTDLANSTHYNVTLKAGATGVKDLAGNPLAADFTIGWTTAAALDTTAPTVVRTIHTNGQVNVPVNTTVGATFSEGINPLSITNLNYFLKATATGTLVPGIITYSGVNGTIVPLSALAYSTNYTVTLKGGASGIKDLAGNSMASDFVISWTTGVAADAIAPSVTANVPLAGSTIVTLDMPLTATFSEAMDPLTITTATFKLATAFAPITPILGTVSYSTSGNVATFNPQGDLPNGRTFTATITKEAKDLAGNAMANDHSWTFYTQMPSPTTTAATTTTTAAATTTTAAPTTTTAAATTTTAAPTTTTTTTTTTVPGINLGAAGNYVILTKAGITTTGTTAITGDMATSPIAATAITGFGLVLDASGTFSKSSLVTGNIYAANYTAPTPDNLTTAVDNMITAYNSAAGRATAGGGLITACPGVGAFSGTIAPGVYTCTVDVSIPGALTLNGSATDVWIFKTTGKLTLAASSNVQLTGGALPKNVFWQVQNDVALGTSAHLEGVVLTATKAALQSGATVNGRLLAQTEVTLIANTIVKPAP